MGGGRLGQREGAVDDHLQPAGGHVVDVAGDHVPHARGGDLGPEEEPYEEEPYKIQLFRTMLRQFGLAGILTAEEIPWSYVFFEEARPSTELLPTVAPRGSPEKVEG